MSRFMRMRDSVQGNDLKACERCKRYFHPFFLYRDFGGRYCGTCCAEKAHDEEFRKLMEEENDEDDNVFTTT